MNSAQMLSMLSTLCQLHTPRGQKTAQYLPYWQSALPFSPEPLSPRQWRRWQSLYHYWQAQAETLLSHALRRKILQASEAEAIRALNTQLAPPKDPEWHSPAQVPSTALFIATTPWGESYGTCCPLELRQLRYQDRFPPLHLSARFADAAILSSGHLALEALSQFLGHKLALNQDFPLWAEIAFPDHIRLVDESASLAFAGAIMQAILAPEEHGQAFSGLVRRDSGQIEPVQGFDLPYGKLEAAFDYGLSAVYLPQNTPLNALPAAGIRLKQEADGVFRYFLDCRPEDVLNIYLVSDLETLYQSAFAAQAGPRLKTLLNRAPEAMPQAGLPGLYAWTLLEERLQNILPAVLQPPLAAFGLSFQQAHELSSAHLPHEAAWLETQHRLQDFLQALLHLLSAVVASVCLRVGSGKQIEALLDLLRTWSHPNLASAWPKLLRDERVQQLLQRFLPETVTPLERLLNFKAQLTHQSHAQSVATFWEELRYLLHSLGLPELQPLLQIQPHGDGVGLRVPRFQEAPLDLPLLRTTGETLSLYAGLETDSQGQPLAVYQNLTHSSRQRFAAACPLLPRQPLHFERQFEPAHRQGEHSYQLPQPKPVQVHCRLSNTSYLPLKKVQLREPLPPDLSVAPALPNWQGELAPGASVDLHYTLQAPQPGTWQLPPPELSYTLPGETQSHFVAASPDTQPVQLHFEAHQQPKIVLRRHWKTSWPLHTRQAFQVVLQLENTHAQAAHKLRWQSGLLPPEWEWLVPEPRLPLELPAYTSLELSLTLQTHLPGQIEWPPLKLSYTGPDGSLCESTLPAETVPIAFNSQLPAAGRQEIYTWIQTQAEQPDCQGIYLYGPGGSGKKHCLQHWPAPGLRLELAGDPYLNLPGETLRRLLIQVLQALEPLALREEERKDTDLLKRFLRESSSNSDQESLLLAALARSLQLLAQQHGRVWVQVFHLELLDPLSLKLLRYLILQAQLSQDQALFFLLSGQPNQVPEILAQLPLHSRELPSLKAADIQALLGEVFPAQDFPAELSQRLLELTGGLLFFLQETLAALVENGQIYRTEGVWKSLPPTEFTIPERIEQLVLKEVQAAQSALPALKMAAVLGLEFSLTELAGSLQQSPAEVETQLKAAFQHMILHRQSRQHWRFSHPLYQQVLYQFCQPEQQALHRSVARYLESLPAPSPEVLASHYRRAGEPQLALRSCFLAGKQHFQQGMLELAQRWLQECAEWLQEEPELENSYADTHRMLGEIARQTSQRSQARDYFLHFLQLARSRQSGSDICRGLLALASVSTPEESAALLEQALGLAEQLQQPELQYQAQQQMAIHLAETRSLEAARPHFFKALGHCQPESLEQARVLESMGYETIKAGQSEVAENDLLISKQIYAQHHNIQGLASVYNRLGACSFYQQEWQRAEHYFSESKKYYERGGNRLRLAHVQHNLGLLAEARRHYDAAETYYRENAILAAHLQDPQLEAFSRLQLGSVYLKIRDFGRASAALAHAEVLLETFSDPRGQAYLKANQGLLALFEGRLPAAGTYLQTAAQDFEPLQDIMGQDLVMLRLGHFHWLSGQLEAAEEDYLRCLASRQNLDRREEDGLERVYHALALIACQRQQWSEARSYFAKAEKILVKTREVSHLAMVAYNQMRLAQEEQDLETALSCKHKRDVLMGLDRYRISQELLRCEGFYTILD